MTISTTSLNALLFVYASALCGALGCVSSGSDAATGGTGGSTGGGTGMTGGASGTTGGSSGTTGGTTSANGAYACPTPTAALITDFTYVAGPDVKTDTASFGDFTATFSGGTFVYPSSGNYLLTADVTKSNWHTTAMVGDYSGVGLYFSGVDPVTAVPGNCTKVDASAFKGIQFSISGNIAMLGTVTFTVGTAGNDVASAWLNSHKAVATDADTAPTFGRCMPAGTMPNSRYDGTCGAPTKTIPVGATPTVVKVLWAELLGGKPEVTVNPAEITFISWVLPAPTGAGSTTPTPYAMDLTIDDLQFIP